MGKFGKEYHLRLLALSVSQSVIHQVLNSSSDDVFKRKGLMKKCISLKEDKGFVITSERVIKIIFKFRAEKILYTLCQAPNISF